MHRMPPEPSDQGSHQPPYIPGHDHNESTDVSHGSDESFQQQGNVPECIPDVDRDVDTNAAPSADAYDEEEESDDLEDDEELDDLEDDEGEEDTEYTDLGESDGDKTKPAARFRRRRKRRRRKEDVFEQRLLGRRALCKSIEDIAPMMLKTVKLRVYSKHLDSRKGIEENILTQQILQNAHRIADKDQILATLSELDPDVDRRNLKWIILFEILLQEETHSLHEHRLEEKVLEYEKSIIREVETLDFFEPKKHDPIRWHYYDTYKIVLDAAWRNENDISVDEAQLLRVLRNRLNISMKEHYLISCYIDRFPKQGRKLHTPDEIHEARKKLQRESLLWSYRDDTNRNIDVIPAEVVEVLRSDVAALELQNTNYVRILQHDSIRSRDLQCILEDKGMDKYGNKDVLIERIATSDLRPSEVLDVLSRSKLAEMCRLMGLPSSGNKPDLIQRLISFYDDLSFEDRTTKDDREVLYSNYELLAARRYADLKAKKVISRDLDVEHLFERATEFLFEKKLKARVERDTAGKRADGRIILDNKDSFLWDCKSVEEAVNLKDHLESQFDLYLRRECEKGYNPLAFLVIAPDFTSQSLRLANQYKARTNWDIALITATALRYLAEQWSATEPSKPFPVRLFNRTELIDRQRADVLLSLA